MHQDRAPVLRHLGLAARQPHDLLLHIQQRRRQGRVLTDAAEIVVDPATGRAVVVLAGRDIGAAADPADARDWGLTWHD